MTMGMRKADNKAGGSRVAFVVAVVVLGLAAVGLNAATSFLELYFKKLPVELTLPLKEIPGQFGPWKQVFADKPLEGDIEHELGTNEYVFRLYADTRVVRPEALEGLEDPDPAKRESAHRALMAQQQQRPDAFVNMAVTYYTGMVDTVAHIPDRCYVADGFQPSEYEIVTWQAGGKPVGARFINFEDQTARGTVNRNVAYFFHVNGVYETDPITGVRLRLQDLRERRGYYAKVELMTQGLKAPTASKVMEDFLGAALPSVERCLPDWEKVKAADAAAKAG